MDKINCKCKCNTISFILSSKDLPDEIAKCYCSICRSLNGSEYMSFCKYDKQIINKINLNDITIIRSSVRAMRGFCSKCNSCIYMLYDDSPNIWLVVDIFQYDLQHIETYDIYK